VQHVFNCVKNVLNCVQRVFNCVKHVFNCVKHVFNCVKHVFNCVQLRILLFSLFRSLQLKKCFVSLLFIVAEPVCCFSIAQRRNRLTTHFSERIPVVRRRMTILPSNPDDHSYSHINSW
jgi:hypothetical protein